MSDVTRDEERAARLARVHAARERVANAATSSGRAYPLEVLYSIVDCALDFILTATTDGDVLFLNRFAPGFGPDDLLGATVFDFMPPDVHGLVRETFARVVATCTPSSYESRGAGAHGNLAHYLTRVSPVMDGDEVIALTLVATDISDRKAIEIALGESEARLRLAVEATGMGAWIWDCVSDEIVWDERLRAIFGLTETPKTFDGYLDRVHPADRERVKGSIYRCMETGHYDDLEHRFVRSDGTSGWLLGKGAVIKNASGKVIKIIGGAFDVTTKRMFEEQVRRSQKTEAIGQLAAGIAHNFNNTLAAMMANIERGLRHAPPELAPTLQHALDAGTHATAVVEELMILAGKPRAHPPRKDRLTSVVERVVHMCQQTFDRAIMLEAAVGDDVPAFAFDASQIEQALLNMCINASHALEGREAPRIGITTSLVGESAPEIAKQPHARRLPHARIHVRDNGAGMDEETQRRMFEPFFTTKGGRGGTGLGLATAYAAVREHRGWIECFSRRDVGTEFTVYLPCEPAVEEGEEAAQKPAAKGNETLLLVDDEELVRRAIGEGLRDAGYTVLEAASGEEALRCVAREGAQIALAILDKSMPHMSGDELRGELAARLPNARVLFLTGWSEADPGETPTLTKPVRYEALTRTVRALLDRRP